MLDWRKGLAESMGDNCVSESEHIHTPVDPSDPRVNRFMHCLEGEERFRYCDRLAKRSRRPKIPRSFVDRYQSVAAMRKQKRGY